METRGNIFRGNTYRTREELAEQPGYGRGNVYGLCLLDGGNLDFYEGYERAARVFLTRLRKFDEVGISSELRNSLVFGG